MNLKRLILLLFLSASLTACGVSGGSGNPVPESAVQQRLDFAQIEQMGSDITRITFDDVEVGSFPTGWKVEATHPEGNLAEWSVQKDSSSGGQVLEMKINDYGGNTFNLCWTDQVTFQSGVVEVKVKAHEGRIDQGGGPIWRVADKDNYYIARWNPLEDNFRVYYVKDGRRVQLGSARVTLPTDQWHTITILHRGSQITGYLNGEKLLEVNDSTFTEAGRVGVWTKADAATSFDDLEVRKE